MANVAGKPMEFGRMYPRGHILYSWSGLGFWPPNAEKIADASYIFGTTHDGFAVNSVKTGKTLLLSWTDLGRLAEAEGLLIEDEKPNGLTAQMRPGLPGDKAEEHSSGTTGHDEQREGLRTGEPVVEKLAGWDGHESPG